MSTPVDPKPHLPEVQHWDPFEETISIAPEPAPDYPKPIIPRWMGYLTGPLIIMALVGFVLIVALPEPYGFIIGGAMFMLGCSGGIFLPKWSGVIFENKIMLRNAADAMGFTYRETIPDERLEDIKGSLKDLFLLRVGGSIPLVISSEMWGTAQGNMPMWLGIAALQSQSFFGGPKQETSDGSKTSHGNVLMIIAAYELDRDTGAEIKLMPEFVQNIGPMDRDVKTESIEFNKHFNIRMRMLDGSAVPDTATVALFQVLTPAFQTTLNGLADEFAARVIIRGDTVYFGGFRNIRTADRKVMETNIKQIVARFAEASSSFKRYAE